MRTRTQIVLLLLGAGLVGCGRGASDDAEPGATTATYESEIPGRHSGDDIGPFTARRFVDHVRLGFELDAEDKVPDGRTARAFREGDAVHLSMEVTDAPAGSVIRVSIHDAATDRRMWDEERTVAPGKSYLGFSLDRALTPGTYRADVIIGDEVVARREFQISHREA